MTAESASAESLFIEHLGAFERIAGALCRRYGMVGDEADDFSSWAKARIIENGYSAIRAFRGESSFTTYLSVVLAMQLREYRVHRWGRWRPSAEARRRGNLAIRLETLVRRDKMRLDEAASTLRSTGETALGDRELAALLAALPERDPLRPMEVGDEPLAFAADSESADSNLDRAAAAAESEAIRCALSAGLEQLETDERVIVRMRFWEGLSVADIARGLGVEQKPLYRKLERALKTLRGHLVASGVSGESAIALLQESS
jgi:RNA polymerase sigma factor (sigma-70 family)